MFHLTTCVAIDEQGRDCRADAIPAAPFPLCRSHLRQAYLFFSDLIRFQENPSEQDVADIAYDPMPAGITVGLGPASVVYYIAIGSHIKIGCTTDMPTRMTSLQPDHIFGTEPGDRSVERQRHEQFAHLRAKKGREYFLPGEDLMAHIAEVCSQPKPPLHGGRLDGIPGYISRAACPACGCLSLVRLWVNGDARCSMCGENVPAARIAELAV